MVPWCRSMGPKYYCNTSSLLKIPQFELSSHVANGQFLDLFPKLHSIRKNSTTHIFPCPVLQHGADYSEGIKASDFYSSQFGTSSISMNEAPKTITVAVSGRRGVTWYTSWTTHKLSLEWHYGTLQRAFFLTSSGPNCHWLQCISAVSALLQIGLREWRTINGRITVTQPFQPRPCSNTDCSQFKLPSAFLWDVAR